jgi:hypothetical protein
MGGTTGLMGAGESMLGASIGAGVATGSISRPGGTPGWLWNLRSESTELDHHNLNRWLGPVQPLHFLSRPRPAPAMGPAGHALHGPSCEPETPHTTSTSGPRASSLHKTISRPLTCTARTRQGASAAWTLPRPSDSDWPGSGQYLQPGRTALGPPCWTRSSVHPGPATARPRRALALHGLRQSQTGPEPTTPPGCTTRARADSTNPVK